MRSIAKAIFVFAVLGSLLSPLVFAILASFSPGSILATSTGEWSFRWYFAFFTDRRWIEAMGRSLMTALLAAAIAVAVGTPLGYAVERYRFPGRSFFVGLAILPLGVPSAVLAMGILPFFFVTGLWGSLLGLSLVHALLGLPLVFWITGNRLREIPVQLEEAARGLGASDWQTVRRVTFPLLWPALQAGAAATFAISWNESMLTLFLATPNTETLPALVWPQLRFAPSPMVAVASTLSVLAASLGMAFWPWGKSEEEKRT